MSDWRAGDPDPDPDLDSCIECGAMLFEDEHDGIGLCNECRQEEASDDGSV
jgi:uncharacterized Zn finger protein (UPF0148 family)